jgi:hypothetical protein
MCACVAACACVFPQLTLCQRGRVPPHPAARCAEEILNEWAAHAASSINLKSTRGGGCASHRVYSDRNRGVAAMLLLRETCIVGCVLAAATCSAATAAWRPAPPAPGPNRAACSAQQRWATSSARGGGGCSTCIVKLSSDCTACSSCCASREAVAAALPSRASLATCLVQSAVSE